MNQTQTIPLTMNTLMVHLKLDSVRASAKPDHPATTPDASGNSRGAVIHGSPKLVVDEQFGSCLRLNCCVSGLGDYLELPMADDISTQGWTFSSWLFLESDKAQILYANGVADFYLDGSVLTLRNVGEALKCEPSVTRNQWVHVAVAVQASGDASVWIDGRLAGQGNIGAATPPDPAVWRVGRYSGDDTTWIFPGNLAHVRLYGKALATAEIQRQRLLDWAPTQDFRVSSPLEFALWDEEQKPALYVAGGEIAHKLTVAIWNKDAHRRPVTFNAPEEIAKIADENERNDFFRRNHHLELRFPTGTLSKNASAGLNADPGRAQPTTGSDYRRERWWHRRSTPAVDRGAQELRPECHSCTVALRYCLVGSNSCRHPHWHKARHRYRRTPPDPRRAARVLCCWLAAAAPAARCRYYRDVAS